MNTYDPHQTDAMLREIFSTMKLDSPSNDFSARVMAQIAPEYAKDEVVDQSDVKKRMWLAIAFSILFFSLLFFTSDIPAFDIFNRFLDFKWFTDFTISDSATQFIQRVWLVISNIRLSYVMIPLIALAMLAGVDYLLNNKTRESSFFTLL